MPFETEDFIHLENPDYKETDWRKNNKGEINIVGTINFGNGVSGRLGLLKSSGKSAVYVYLFSKDKWDMKTAKEWLEKDHAKRGKSMDFKNKKFKMVMPLVKGETEKDGHYYIKFALSTTNEDLEGEEVSEACLDDMISQAKNLNSFQNHLYGLDDIIGPIVDSWKQKGENGIQQMWIKVRVRPSMKDTIKELIDTGVRLGGSIGGSYIEDRIENGKRILEKINLLEGSLTPIPVNQDTLGTASEDNPEIGKGCQNGMCSQIIKSIKNKYYKNSEVEDVSDTDMMEDLYNTTSKVIKEELGKEYQVNSIFPESVFIKSDKGFKEVNYAHDENNVTVIGEVVDVPESYVEQKKQIYSDSIVYDLQDKSIGDDTMDEKEIRKMLEENNKAILKEMKQMIEEEEEEEEEEPEKSIDAGELAKEIKAEIFKSLGIKDKPPEKEAPDEKIMIMDTKSFKEMQDETIKKTILGIAKQREGVRKSKPTGKGKFEMTETPDEDAKKGAGKKISTKEAAEKLAAKKGLI